MTALEREAHVLAKLLKAARLQADEASRRLGALQISYAEADDAIRILVDAIHDEETAARATCVVGFEHLAGFLAGAHQKRSVLEATKASLSVEIADARRALEDAYAEMKRFEHLAERLRTAIVSRRRRKEIADVDAAALIRFSRS